MSVDSGIYILKTPKNNGEGFEYRVSHWQAIENIWDGNDDGNPYYVITIFGESLVYNSDEEVLKKASELEQEILNDDLGILEYGISHIGLPHTWEHYQENYKPKKEE